VSKDDLKELASGFRKRTLVTAKLAGKMGLAMAKRQLGGGKSRDDDDPVEVEKAKEGARALVRQMGSLKGLVMKVGQMASYLPGALPEEAQQILSQLQAESVAMSYDSVAEVVCEELGDSPDALFEEFETTPFAAASIGQVHRARLHGRRVAVKIQYPGIEDVLKSDLSTIGFMTKVSTFGLPIDSAAIVEELRSRILEECDYRIEAKNQRELGTILSRDPDARVPEVIGERSSRRVITTEYVDAKRFAPFVAEASQAARNRAGEVIFRTCIPTLFHYGIYNGDPHPGNYLFDDDGRVTFLDFGCVRRFDEKFIETWKTFARGILDGDRARFPERFRSLGMVGREKGFDFDHQWEVLRYLYTPFVQRDPFFTYSDDYVRQSYGLMIFDNPNQRRTSCPPEWLLLNRLQWGMNAVLAKLEATGPWPDYFGNAARAPFGASGQRADPAAPIEKARPRSSA
jgi:predicted unusual protein kinase regulating ubiquinone biosynthesis (AarF/ABC1/UbiB family)